MKERKRCLSTPVIKIWFWFACSQNLFIIFKKATENIKTAERI